MVGLIAIGGSKWKRNLISVKEEKFTVENDTAPSNEANRQPATAPRIARTRLSTRKLPSTARLRKPRARSVPISRTRLATWAYMVIIAPSVAPKEKKMAITVPSARTKVESGPQAAS